MAQMGYLLASLFFVSLVASAAGIYKDVFDPAEDYVDQLLPNAADRNFSKEKRKFDTLALFYKENLTLTFTLGSDVYNITGRDQIKKFYHELYTEGVSQIVIRPTLKDATMQFIGRGINSTAALTWKLSVTEGARRIVLQKVDFSMVAQKDVKELGKKIALAVEKCRPG